MLQPSNTNIELPPKKGSTINQSDNDKASKDFVNTNSSYMRKTSEKSDMNFSKINDRSPSKILENRTTNLHFSNSSHLSMSPSKNNNVNTTSPNKRNRSKIDIADSNKIKKKVTFKEKNFLEIVSVESFKKYNVEMSYNEGEGNETTRCKCIIY
jgi:hypothetical protein